MSWSLEHHDICLRLTHEHAKCNSFRFFAAAYDDVVRRHLLIRVLFPQTMYVNLPRLLAEKSKSGWTVSLKDTFTKINRDLIERAVVVADKALRKMPVTEPTQKPALEFGGWNKHSWQGKSNYGERKGKYQKYCESRLFLNIASTTFLIVKLCRSGLPCC